MSQSSTSRCPRPRSPSYVKGNSVTASVVPGNDLFTNGLYVFGVSCPFLMLGQGSSCVLVGITSESYRFETIRPKGPKP